MYELPVTIVIDEEEYHIRNRGDYRMVLDCFALLQDEELDSTERILACLAIFYEDITLDELLFMSEEDVQLLTANMYKFFNCGQDEDKYNHTPYKLIDWDTDSQLIMSAINNVANKEVRAEEYIHWWTFMGYYMCIGDGSFATIVNIRSKLVKGKKLEKFEREFKNENPQYFVWNHQTLEEREAENYIKDLWNNNGRKEEINNGKL